LKPGKEQKQPDEYSRTHSKTRVDAIGHLNEKVMVALILGQSNASNSGQRKYSSSKEVFNYYKNAFYRCEDPLLGATGHDGSIWSRLGDTIVSEGLFEKVIFVPVAVGGSSSVAWAPGGDCFGRIEETVMELERIEMPITHVFWVQGETDCQAGTVPENYQRNVRSMVAALRAMNVHAPVFIATATYYKHKTCPALQLAQQELASEQKRIHRGPNLDSLIGAVYRYDGTHFNEDGLQAAADQWVTVLSNYAGSGSRRLPAASPGDGMRPSVDSRNPL
jgi:lysophospholipase L1-like esterase